MGSSCFKITNQKGIQVGSKRVDAEPTINKMCLQERTRLASVESSEEKEALLNWAFAPDKTNDINVGC